MNPLWIQDKEAVRRRLSGNARRMLTGVEKPLLATVSGVLSTHTSLVRYADEHLGMFGIITTKSFQVVPNAGNREPIICEVQPGSFGNSVGLKNPGMEVAIAELRQLRASYRMRAWLNVSVSASCAEDFITLVGCFEEVADIIELNFSCPHASAGYGASIGCSASLSAQYVQRIRAAFPHCKALIFPKLTPNVPDIGQIAKAVIDAGADGIVAINTVGPQIHIEPYSGQPILQNKLGGKGGKSGSWIHQEALSCVATIRQAVGPDVPIIGMGGVSSGHQVAAMVVAGADAVGIGSAFGKVHQKDWAAYGEALVSDAFQILCGKGLLNTSEVFRQPGRSMVYRHHTIRSMVHHTADILILTLDGRLDYDAGQFVFLWIPGIGEKPFSVAEADPLVFVIKRRGPFTEALFNLHAGDSIYLRGLYGAPLEMCHTRRALLVAGGTGVAVLPALAKRLEAQGTAMDIYVGTSTEGDTLDGKALLQTVLEPYGNFLSVADAGIPGRVLASLDRSLTVTDDLACYIVGPTPFMAAAAKKVLASGVPAQRIQLSMELNTLCGIGMCGDCACGNRLTCQWGTFVSYDYLKKEAPQLL
ncbi:MAG: nitronate monooxygenase [Sphaerochaetaceae bacterium]